LLTPPLPPAAFAHAGVVFTGANVTLIDGFDVEFVQLVRRCATLSRLGPG
jgi:hypothetical protein